MAGRGTERLKQAGVVLVAIFFGYLAQHAGVPLAWVLAPLIVTAGASIAGLSVFAPIRGRRLGQMIVGSTIGLHVTATVAAGLVAWLPVMLLSAVASVAITSTLALVFCAITRVDRMTAFFAMLPGGLSEMATIGSSRGASSEVITLCQALRVALVVCITPPVIVSLGIDGNVIDPVTSVTLSYWLVVPVVATAFFGVLIFRWLHMHAVWMIGALFAVGFLTALDLFHGSMPQPIFYLGQFLIGVNIGSRFRRETVMRLPRLVLVMSALIVLLIAILFAAAWGLSHLAEIDLASAALAISPGGLAEMSTTAQVLHLSIVLVTGFHVVRSFLVNGFALHIWNLLARTGYARSRFQVTCKDLE